MPFKRKKTSSKPQAEAEAPAESSSEQTASIEQFNSSVDTSFFYTSDKKLNAIDDADILKQMQLQYPEFKQTTKDSQLKKVFLEMLDNEDFIKQIMQQYDLDLHDLFKLVYKQYSSLFNALFIRKVKDKLQSHNYGDV